MAIQAHGLNILVNKWYNIQVMKTKNKSLRLLTFLALMIFSFTYTQVSYAKDAVLTDEKAEWLRSNASEIYFAPEKDFPPLIWNQYGELFGLSKDYFIFGAPK